jgi:tetratricopeptide (TPR) repeat protein
MENLVQTGVYAVQFVHNDWLQIGLDVGWIPMLLYPAAVVKTLCSSKVSGTKKIMLAVIFAHGLLDFDLSYSIMLCMVFLIMDQVEFRNLKNFRSETNSCLTASPLGKWVTTILLFLAAGLCIYIAIPLIAYYNGEAEMAVKFYPWYTEAKLELLSQEDNAKAVDNLADEILAQNDTCALAYYGKAMAAYCQEDYQGVIQYQREAIARDAFRYEEYLNYAVMLKDGMTYYEDKDEEMYQLCCQEIGEIPKLIQQAKDRVSKLGSMIDDQPELSIDPELYGILHLVE